MFCSSPLVTSRLCPQHQSGTTTVEVAVALLVTLTIVLLALDGARLINAYSSVSHAAREGVRFAAVRGTEAGSDANRTMGDAPATEQQIENYLQNQRVPNVPLRVDVVWPPQSGGGVSKTAGSVVEVTVESDFTPLIPMLDPITVTSTSRMVVFY